MPDNLAESAAVGKGEGGQEGVRSGHVTKGRGSGVVSDPRGG